MWLTIKKKSWYYRIALLDLTICYAITCLVLGMLIGGWFWFVYLPMRNSLYYYQQKVQQEHIKNRHALNAQQSEIAIQKEIEQTTISYDKVARTMFENEHTYFEWLLALCVAHHIIIESYTEGVARNTKHSYKQSIFHYQFRGKLEDILSLLQAIKDSKQLITMHEIQIAKVQNAQFLLSCDIRLFLLQEKSPST